MGGLNSRDRRRRAAMVPDPRIEEFRIPESDCCWWCGDLAATQEHRIKHSTIRRVANSTPGGGRPSDVYKVSDDYRGVLRSLKKGSQVKWRKNLCADCNNSRSQPFDRAYDVMEAFIVEYADELMRWPRLTWSDVYGEDWQAGAANLARYFGKQLGCMLADQRLPVPTELIAFLNGADRCPSVAFMIFRNWKAGSAHRMMRRDGFTEGITTFVGLLPSSLRHQDGRLIGVDFGYHIGYVWFCAQWWEDTDRSSWWEHPVIDLPLLNANALDRISWKARELGVRMKNWPKDPLRGQSAPR